MSWQLDAATLRRACSTKQTQQPGDPLAILVLSRTWPRPWVTSINLDASGFALWVWGALSTIAQETSLEPRRGLLKQVCFWVAPLGLVCSSPREHPGNPQQPPSTTMSQSPWAHPVLPLVES